VEGDLEIIPQPMSPPRLPLDCGNSGSTIRMLTGFLAGQNIPAILTGDTSVLKRPMRRVADPLRQMGAVIDLEKDEFGPIVLHEGVKHALEYEMPISSAQVKSAILFAGLRYPGTRVHEKIGTRDHTERLFEYLKLDTSQAVNQIPAFE